MSFYPQAAQSLVELEPAYPFFVGIDSDGSAFDTMELKHKECYIPATIKYWHLQSISKYVRETAEFVNLYSMWRGTNRWPALIQTFDMLRARPQVRARNAQVPAVPGLRAFVVDDVYPKSDSGLRSYMEARTSPELETALTWTTQGNAIVARIVRGVPPFPYVRQSLDFLADKADLIVVSATPVQALAREWEEHDIAEHMQVIAGQEMGSKALHLQLATNAKYAPNHVLMVGDAPGDMRAAHTNDALFYPINPGHEEESWQRFYTEAVHRFLAGEYAGAYEAALIAEFEALLPRVPSWQCGRANGAK